jgi:NAD(P)H-hydrate epimerase
MLGVSTRKGAPPAAKDAPLPVLGEDSFPLIAILAGSGGNGGGGLCCARHLHNRGLEVCLILSKDPGELAGAARAQLDILRAAGLCPLAPPRAQAALSRARIVVDALIGYSLRGAPRGRAAELIRACNAHASRVLSLDLPSGLDATTGETPGAVVRPERTLTLALPKTGLRHAPGGPGHGAGDLYLADIGIPPEVYARLDIPYRPPFAERYWVRLER